MSRSNCFGGHQASDPACLGDGSNDPSKGKCAAFNECAVAQKAILSLFGKSFADKIWSDLNADQRLKVEAALKAPAEPAKRERSRADVEAPKTSKTEELSGFEELENSLNADMDGITGASGDVDDLPELDLPEGKVETTVAKEEAPVVAEKAKRGRKPKTAAEVTAKAEEKIREEVPEQVHEAMIEKAAPKEVIKVEGITNTVLAEVFGIAFNPIFQALIPEVMSNILSFELNEDGTIAIYLKNFKKYDKEIRHIAYVTQDCDGEIVVSIAIRDMKFSNILHCYTIESIKDASNFEPLLFMINSKIQMIKGKVERVAPKPEAEDNGDEIPADAPHIPFKGKDKKKRGRKAGAKKVDKPVKTKGKRGRPAKK